MFFLLFCLLAQCFCRTQVSWKNCSNFVLQILLLHAYAASHGATHRTIISELSVGNDIQVPSVEVLQPRHDDSVSVQVDSALRVAIDSLFLTRRLRRRSFLSRREWSSEQRRRQLLRLKPVAPNPPQKRRRSPPERI